MSQAPAVAPRRYVMKPLNAPPTTYKSEFMEKPLEQRPRRTRPTEKYEGMLHTDVEHFMTTNEILMPSYQFGGGTSCKAESSLSAENKISTLPFYLGTTTMKDAYPKRAMVVQPGGVRAEATKSSIQVERVPFQGKSTYSDVFFSYGRIERPKVYKLATSLRPLQGSMITQRSAYREQFKTHNVDGSIYQRSRSGSPTASPTRQAAAERCSPMRMREIRDFRTTTADSLNHVLSKRELFKNLPDPASNKRPQSASHPVPTKPSDEPTTVGRPAVATAVDANATAAIRRQRPQTALPPSKSKK